MKHLEKRETRADNKPKINIWKWAFITLLVFMLSLFFMLINALQPVEIDSPNQGLNDWSETPIQLSTSLNKEDTERLMNNYLSVYNKENDESYSLSLNNHLIIDGMLDFFNLAVPFSLFFDPYVMENGNVQLRGEAVEVGDFSLPIQFVMRLIGNQMDFPPFIAFDSESQIIILNFNELTKDYNFDLQMTKIDLVNDVIELDLLLSEQLLFEEIQFEDFKEVQE